jgi:hypothetical protein
MLAVLNLLKQKLCTIKCIQLMSTFQRGTGIIDQLENSIHKINFREIYSKIDRMCFLNSFQVRVIQIKKFCRLNS